MVATLEDKNTKKQKDKKTNMQKAKKDKDKKKDFNIVMLGQFCTLAMFKFSCLLTRVK